MTRAKARNQVLAHRDQVFGVKVWRSRLLSMLLRLRDLRLLRLTDLRHGTITG